VEKVWYTSFLYFFLLSVVHGLMLWEACGLQWCLWNGLEQGLIIKTCNWKRTQSLTIRHMRLMENNFLCIETYLLAWATWLIAHFPIMMPFFCLSNILIPCMSRSHELVFTFMDYPIMPK
jgi:hypothetical protein